MNSLLLTLALVAQWAPASHIGSLEGVASLSPKPEICPVSERFAGIWSRARAPRAERYCVSLAKGYGLLGAGQPRAAILEAERASEWMAGQAAPAILKARAFADLGQLDAAWEQFSNAEKLAAFRLDAVLALHDYARSALATGHSEVARQSYRRLVTRTSLLDNRRRALQVYIEAALAVMQEGSESLPEVLAYLDEATRKNDSTLYPETLRALAVLARERNGESERAKALRSELDDRGLERELSRSSRNSVPLVLEVDREMLRAVCLERLDPSGARDKWKRVLSLSEQHGSPWVSELRARLDSKLSRGR